METKREVFDDLLFGILRVGVETAIMTGLSVTTTRWMTNLTPTTTRDNSKLNTLRGSCLCITKRLIRISAFSMPNCFTAT